MILAYGVTHEKWVWDIRGEPGVVEAFSKVYDDEDLIVSFDVVNVQFAKYSHRDTLYTTTKLTIAMQPPGYA